MFQEKTMKIQISKTQWESIGMQAGWMKTAAQNMSTGEQITNAFGEMSGGVKEGTKAKAIEYAKRIKNGEPKEKVLQGLGPSWEQAVDKELANLNQAPNANQAQQKSYSSQQITEWARKGSPALQKAVGRILSGNDSESLQNLNKAISGDQASRQWLSEYMTNMV